MENHEKKNYTPQEKVAILKRHLVEKKTVPDLWDEYHLHPTVFYRGLKPFFENGAAAFSPADRPRRREEAQRPRIEAREAKLRRKDEVLAERMEEHVALKKSWGNLKGQWIAHDTRDQVIDFVHRWSDATEIAARTFVLWLGLATSKFYRGQARYGQVNEQNAWIPRDFWLEVWEKQAIIEFHDRDPLEGYRRLTFMMLDADVVAVSPASVGRVLHAAGRLARWKPKASLKGRGFQPPLGPHAQGHVDISSVNLAGTFYDLGRGLEGSSRDRVHGELRESMKEPEVEIILERAREKFPLARPPIISDNGPPFIARDFKEFIRLGGMTPVRTSPFYPPSNGQIERGHKSLKGECLRPGVPNSAEEARRLLTG